MALKNISVAFKRGFLDQKVTPEIQLLPLKPNHPRYISDVNAGAPFVAIYQYTTFEGISGQVVPTFVMRGGHPSMGLGLAKGIRTSNHRLSTIGNCENSLVESLLVNADLSSAYGYRGLPTDMLYFKRIFNKKPPRTVLEENLIIYPMRTITFKEGFFFRDNLYFY